MSLRIAHVLSSFALGGQERVALELAAAQVRRGHEVTAVSLAPLPHGVLAKEFLARKIEVRSVPKGRSFDARTIVRLAKLFREQRVAVVHTHNPQPLAYGAPAGRLAGVAVVHTKHGANPDGGRRLWLRRAAGHLAHAYVAVSGGTAEVARRNRECWPRRLRVIPNGVDLEAFGPDAAARREVRAELGIPPETFLLGTVGRVSVEKDHALLVRAARPILGARVRLVIVGDGPELANVRAEASPHEPWIVLTGVRHDIPRVLASLDAFVLSSRSEGSPLALLEAMSCGLPVVATNVGGVAEVIDLGRAGALVPPRDEQALTRTLAELVADPRAAEDLGRRARRRACRYDLDAVVDRYMALYREVSS